MRRRPLVPRVAALAAAALPAGALSAAALSLALSLSLSFALALALVLALSGCAVVASTPVTDEQARERFVTVLDDAQALIGGDWTVMDDPTPRECVIPVGVTGERFPALRVGDPSPDVADAAGRLEQAWNAAGMRVTRTDLGEVVEVSGVTAAGELVVARVSESASTLIGESECRPR